MGMKKIYTIIILLAFPRALQAQPVPSTDTLVAGGVFAGLLDSGAVSPAYMPPCMYTVCGNECYSWVLPFSELNPDSTFTTTLDIFSTREGFHQVQIWRESRWIVLDTCMWLTPTYIGSAPPLRYTFPKKSSIAIFGIEGDTNMVFCKGMEIGYSPLWVDLADMDTLCSLVAVDSPRGEEQTYMALDGTCRIVSLPLPPGMYLEMSSSGRRKIFVHLE